MVVRPIRIGEQISLRKTNTCYYKCLRRSLGVDGVQGAQAPWAHPSPVEAVEKIEPFFQGWF